ncbi:hypothetical protein M3Y99_00170900 [Aphelenchoides fujianensis]|nr:hypothetical protein M3Y99_00170900 [Aphelenchoides fujianensis]
MSSSKDQVVIKTGLKLKKGTLMKKKKQLKLEEIDLTIKKEAEAPRKTAAELAFEKRQRETAFERLAKRASKSHREKIEQFNKDCENLSEFNECAKVSWTK